MFLFLFIIRSCMWPTDETGTKISLRCGSIRKFWPPVRREIDADFVKLFERLDDEDERYERHDRLLSEARDELHEERQVERHDK